jgi:predicted DNA-binding transcriptional regulator AlpA
MTFHENDDPLLETGPAAAFLGNSVPTLVRWRQTGEGPDYIKVGRLVKYRKSALERFLDECTRRPHRRARLLKTEAGR